MQNRLRAIRRAQGLTLADVAARCTPPTTAVTIGRIETGSRQLTQAWMDRIAAALGVDPAQLLPYKAATTIPVAAELTAQGACALTAPLQLTPPAPTPHSVGLLIRDSQGDYRAGDQLWLEQLPPERFAQALNTDVLVPRPVGRFVFGRLVAVEGARLHLLPASPGSRQQVIANAPWAARAHTLVRPL